MILNMQKKSLGSKSTCLSVLLKLHHKMIRAEQAFRACFAPETDRSPGLKEIVV